MYINVIFQTVSRLTCLRPIPSFVALVFLGPRVTLLVVDLCPIMPCVAELLELL